MEKLTIQLVTWNSLAFLPEFFESLKNQTFKDWDLIMVDNASSDGTVEYLRKELELLRISYQFHTNNENTGFAGGHNLAWKRGAGEYVAIVNPDIVMEPDCLEKLVTYLDNNLEVGVVAPRLMRLDNKNVIDSLGLKIFRSRRVVEIGAGEKWNNQITKPTPIFGASGTFFVARRSVLNKVLLSDELFDSWYGSYKEDVDLAWRLQSAGIKTVTLPTAVAYHARGAKPALDLNDTSAAENKSTQPEWLKFNSYRNHLVTIYKNETWQNFALDFLWILWYELKKFGWFLLFDRNVLRSLKSIWWSRKKLRQKRQEVKTKRAVSYKEFRKWL